ncbi:hypothetical protein D3C86_1528650 [compost metagenome]
MQRCRLGRCIGAIDVQLSAGQLLANQRPDRGFQPQHRIPVGGVAKVADMEKMRAFFERYRCAVWKVDHQRTPVQQMACKSELLDQQFDFHLRNHQCQITAIKSRNLAFGQVGIGHVLKFFAQRRGEQFAKIIVVVTGLQTLLEPLVTAMPEALQVATFKHAQGSGAVFFDAPAELFFHHELVEQHDVGLQFADKGVEAAVVQLDRHFINTQCRQVGALLPEAGRTAEGDIPALLQENLENLHHMPAGRRRTGFGPDVADHQDFGCAGVTHKWEFP